MTEKQYEELRSELEKIRDFRVREIELTLLDKKYQQQQPEETSYDSDLH